jgi:putative glutamine amidotransferase
MQSMNVATGGTMYQDIPTEIYKLNYVEDVFDLGPEQNHRNYWRNLTADKQLMGNSFHKIRFHKHHHFFDKLLSGSNLTPSVYSSHHQAVKDIGQGFQVIATSMDGKVVEIMAHKIYKNVFGVQFHPESYSLYSKGGDEYKVAPNDTILISHSELLREKKSVHFHRKFWQNFGEFFD